MVNIKKKLFLLAFCVPIMIHAQNNEKGIRWTTNLSLEQVKIKALQEGKYVFLDCFTTWCGPCKQMDNWVYASDTVGNFFNEHFISVKVQMDKTKKDNEQIKAWYEDAATLEKKYYVNMYPTYIFLSPQGFVVHKDAGIKSVHDFISLGEMAILPGKKYEDPNKDYEILIDKFKQGEVVFDRLPFMISRAIANRDIDLGLRLVKLHVDYVSGLPATLRYTQENIRLWASLPLASTSRLFKFFYVDGVLIDKVMRRKGFSRDVVDAAIMNEIIMPFLKKQASGSETSMSGGYLTTIAPTLKTADVREADWNKLFDMLNRKFNSDCVRRNILSAKIEWYERHENKAASAKAFLLRINKYPPDLTPDPTNIVASVINNRGYDAFEFSIDENVLNGYIKWMEKVLVVFSEYRRVSWMDTYASLLYKVGRRNDAIKWMEKAVALVPMHIEKNDFDVKLDEMKRGERLSGALVWK